MSGRDAERRPRRAAEPTVALTPRVAHGVDDLSELVERAAALHRELRSVIDALAALVEVDR